MSVPEKKGVAQGAMNANRLAMSKALGAAFLNHQVEQLEKTVTGGAGNNIGNWRNRKQSPAQSHGGPAMTGKRPPMAPGIKVASRKPEESQAARKAARAQQSKEANGGVKHEAAQGAAAARRSVDEDKHDKKPKNWKEKDADIVVVDASVLVHALYQIKKWCKDGREEVVIVPLEALNTLDLLKKGSNILAQRARAASRLLEAQVGTNPRIRVQQDDAYVPWDKIKFNDDPISTGTDASSLSTSPGTKPVQMSPEWVRRTICCAHWEIQNAATTLAQSTLSSSPPPKPSVLESSKAPGASSTPANVILAVLRPSDSSSDPRAQLPGQGHASKNSDSSAEGTGVAHHLEPVVPLPAPTLPPQNKFEPRASGTLISQWAKKSGIKIMELDPTTPGKGEAANEDGHHHPGNGNARPRHVSPRPPGGGGAGPGGRARRTSGAAGDGHGYPFGHKKGHSGGAETGLVERPAAVRTMMEMVAQPKTVVRVLARGEKLDP